MKNLSVVIFLFVTLLFNGYSQVVINEYQCSNVNTTTDANGDNSDWYELYNTTGTAIDLNGYYLSDRITNPTKWQIPTSIMLPANGFITVFANGGGTVTAGEIHAGFKLTQTKPEYVVVSDASGTILDNIQLVSNQVDHSSGRDTDGGANWVVYTNPTQGSSNGMGADLYTETPIFSQPSGNYTGSVSVAITSSDAGATIRYTLDGSEPGNGSMLYSGPITINNTSVLRAICFTSTPNRLTSFIETNTYFIDETHYVKIISVCGGDQGGDGVMDLLNDNLGWFGDDPVGHLELFDKDMNLLSEGSGDFNKHGNDSWSYDQRGFDYITRDQYGYNYAVVDTIFNGKDRPSFQRLILKAAASDNYPFEWGGAHIRDAWCQSISQIGGLKVDERSHEPCVVYVDGQYWGVYEIREKVDDHDFTSYYYDQGRNDIDFIKTWGGTWADYGDMVAWNNDYNFITTNDMSIPANFAYADSVFNWKSLIDYTVLNSYMVCKDMLNWNTAWWHGKDPNGDKKKWRYALWDMDAIYGHYINFTGIPDESMQADPCNIETSSSIDDPEGHMVILNSLLENPEVDQWYTSRYIDLANTLFTCDVLIGHVDSLVALIEPEMQGHVNRWGGSYAGWQANVQAFKDSILNRCSSLDSGLIDCYNLDGPYRIAYNVTPMNTGDVKINSVTPVSYPYAGDYFGGIDINIEAIPANGNIFHYWEVINQPDSVSLDSLSNPAIFRIGQADSVIAHFIVADSTYLTFNVDPLIGGNMAIDGNTPPTYPHSDYYTTTSQLLLEATPQPGYLFLNWTSTSTAFTASNIANPVTISVDLVDSIVAHFVKIDSVLMTFDVTPVSTGDLVIDGFNPIAYPYTDSIIVGAQVAIEALPQPGYVFDHWSSTNGTVFTNSDTDNPATISIGAADIIIAHFILDEKLLTFDVLPDLKGKIKVDNVSLGNIYPISSNQANGQVLELKAVPKTGYLFVTWESVNGTALQPSADTNIVSITVTQPDTIKAYFIPDTFDIKFNVNPIAGGNIAIDGTIPNAYVFSDRYIAGTVIQLEAINSENYLFDHWETINNEIVPDSMDLEVSFTVKAIDSIVAIFLELPPEGAFVPMAFSPNNDGNNDWLYVYGEQIVSMDIEIFDRWGKKVFQTNDQNIGWDGRYNENDVIPGVYYYKVNAIFQNGNSATTAGDVTLVR